VQFAELTIHNAMNFLLALSCAAHYYVSFEPVSPDKWFDFFKFPSISLDLSFSSFPRGISKILIVEGLEAELQRAPLICV